MSEEGLSISVKDFTLNIYKESVILHNVHSQKIVYPVHDSYYENQNNQLLSTHHSIFYEYFEKFFIKLVYLLIFYLQSL
jgi:hypothetical protein